MNNEQEQQFCMICSKPAFDDKPVCDSQKCAEEYNTKHETYLEIIGYGQYLVEQGEISKESLAYWRVAEASELGVRPYARKGKQL